MRGLLLDPVNGRPVLDRDRPAARELPLEIREHLAHAGLLRFLGLPQPEMFDAHKNFAYSTVATAPSPASSGTSLVVQTGDGAKFPTAPFNATVWPSGSQPLSSNAEIVRVTAIATDTLTLTRAQESTSARSIIVGDQIAATITAKTITDIESAAPSSGLIVSTILAASAASFDFTAIPSSYTNLRLLLRLRTDASSTFDRSNVRLNNDSGTNYGSAFVEGGTSGANNVSTSGNAMQLADGSGNTAEAGAFASYELLFPLYANTSFWKFMHGTFVSDRITGGIWTGTNGGFWRSTAAINRITITPNTGSNYLAGSAAYLYGS